MREIVETAPLPADCRDLAADLGPLLGRLTLMLRREVSRLPVSPAQAAVLVTLLERPSRISDLTEHAAVAQPTMTVLIDRLERQGWAQRVPDPDDRRAVQVEITPSGREVIQQLLAQRMESLAQRLQGLTPAERIAIARAIPALKALVE